MLSPLTEEAPLIRALLQVERIRAIRDEALIRKINWEQQETLAALQQDQLRLQMELAMLQNQGSVQPQNHHFVPSTASISPVPMPGSPSTPWTHQNKLPTLALAETPFIQRPYEQQRNQPTFASPTSPTDWPQQSNHGTQPMPQTQHRNQYFQ